MPLVAAQPFGVTFYFSSGKLELDSALTPEDLSSRVSGSGHMSVNKLDDQAIFEVARKISSREAREAYLAQVSRDDSAMAQRIEALLQAHDESDSFLECPPPGISIPPTIGQVVPERAGTQIGPYKLLEQIGEGGMGVVYVAEQSKPIRRRVALKIIKPGMDSRQVIARFEAERQTLAIMDHPNIAKVLDAGTTEAGLPYFVMELVKGTPITEFCDAQKLATRERMKLFATLCQAVQHAHQKGIIHRDIKPSNVLVEVHDVVPVPKVIDFGVAKAMSQQLSDKTLYTGFAQTVGTPLYMSPEQAGQSSIDIDTRSDVYSLGVLLYELLTGSTPFESDTLRKAGPDEMRRIIREVDPPRPSARISTLVAEALSTISDRRQVDPRKLSQQLQGELDWIVMKALEKDRNRRYESASAFAADVERFLNDEPVKACPPSTAYRLRKFVRKNRVIFAATVAVAAALLIGTSVSTWQVLRANQARADSDTQRARAEGSQQMARANLKKAREAVDQMLLRVSNRLKNEPQTEQLRTELLQDAMTFYGVFLQQDPSNPELQFEAGNAYRAYGNLQGALGQSTGAEQTYKQAVEVFKGLVAQSPANLEYRKQLALSYADLCRILTKTSARMADAQTASEKALEIARQLALDSPSGYQGLLARRLSDVGVCLNMQGRTVEAEAIFREALAIQRKLPDDYSIGTTLSYLGSTSLERNKYDEAESYYREALAAVEKPKQSAQQLEFRTRLRIQLAITLHRKGDLTEAESLLRENIPFYENLTERSPNTPSHSSNLASIYMQLGSILNEVGKTAEAEQFYQKALAIGEQLISLYPNTPLYQAEQAATRHNLAGILSNANRLTEAAEEYRKSAVANELLAEQNDKVPDYPVSQCYSLWCLAGVLDNANQTTEAVTVLRRCATIAEQTVRTFPQHFAAKRACVVTYGNLGLLHYRLEQYEPAARALERMFEDLQFAFTEVEGFDSAFMLAISNWRIGDPNNARKWYDQAVAELERNPPKNDDRYRQLREEAALLLGIVKESPASAADAAK